MKIGEFARLGGVSIRTLRHYDEIALLKPERTDPESGYRHYGAAQLLTLRRLLALRDVGFCLEQCQVLIQGRVDLQTALLAQRLEIQNHIQVQTERLARLDAWVSQKGAHMTQFDIYIQTIPTLRMASLRDLKLVKRTPEGGQDITAMWEALWAAVPNSKRETGTTLIWHDSGDSEYPEPELLHPLPEGASVPAPLIARELPEIARAAKLGYRGHYADQGMTDAFAAIHHFGEDSLHPAREAVRQVFKGAAGDADNIFLIELQLPVS